MALVSISENIANRLPVPRVETITPESAKLILDAAKNSGFVNRGLRQNYIDTLASAIRSGHWQYNGDAIRIDLDGVLIDGQHRLHAVVRAGIPIVTLVIRGLPREVMDTIDGGRPRKVSDRLTLKYGTRSSRSISATLNVIGAIESGFSHTSRTLSFWETEEVLSRYGDLVAWAESVIPHKISPGIPSGGASIRGPLCVFAAFARETMEEMAQRFVSGDCRKGEPTWAMRSAVAQSRAQGGVQRYELVRRVMRCMEAEVNGESLSFAKPDGNVVERIIARINK